MEEVRIYLGFSATSVSLLTLLIVGILAASKDHLILMILIQISILSYSGLLILLHTYAMITAQYSKLIEQKINALLESPVFIFESYYGDPKP